ncbi:MAG: exonuclease domain-containing protein [Candidatus Cryosericum sp.]
MKNEQELVFFDLETTGLDQASDQIIEIGAVKVRGGKEVERFEQFCRLKEGARLPEFISALTGITPLDLEPAEPVDQVVDQFLQFAGGSPLLAHNSDFDEGFLRKALHGQLANSVFDTLELARIFFPDLQSHSLVALVDSLEIKKEEAHRALGDSLSLFRFYRKLKDKIAQSALPEAIVQRIQLLYPVVVDLGLLDAGDARPPVEPSEMASLEAVLTDLDLSRLPHLKALRPGVAGDTVSPEMALLTSGRDVLLQCEPQSLRARYLGDIQASPRPGAVLLRAPAAIEPLLEDARPGDTRPLWISQESPNNLVCLMLLDGATRSTTMRREFGFELSALVVYEWETRSVFIPGMPLFLKKSRLVNHISAAHCQLEPSCPFHDVCPVRESLVRARAAHLHVTDLAEAPHVFHELGESTPVLVSSPETEKLMSDVLDVPEVQVSSIMLRIIAGVAGERHEVPGLAIVAGFAARAGTLLEELYVHVTHQENAGVRGRIAIGETLWSASEFAALRSTADAMVEAFANAGEALPPTMRMAYLTQCSDLASVLNNADNPAYAVWMERQGQEIVLASTRTVLASRIRAYNADVQFLLAGTSVCPAGDQQFLPETFGLAGPNAAVVVDHEPEGPRIPTFVTLHLPKPNESGFEKNGARLIAETMRRFPGKAMVASNSLETLHRMQSFLAREPGLAEYSLLLPKNGHTRTQLLEQFSGQDKAILLIPFDYLSFGDIISAKFLFVTKLQFPNSFLPTVTRLKQALKEKRGDAFRQFDLPYALALLQYTLHQMDPHTLRSVFMLDNRSFSSVYADRIRTVLPTPSLFLPMENQESLLQHLDRWIRNQTL